jgi:polyhydroxybutyrate depolymerase
MESNAAEMNYTPGEVTLAQIEYDGLNRDYRYYVPRGFDLEKKHPLILVLHGYNQPIDTMVRGFAPTHPNADKDGTVIVYPAATGSMEQSNLAWNTTYGRLGSTDKVNDIGYLTFLIDLFLKKLNCDPDRVYVTGTSMGGAMTYTLSCYIPQKLAAIAPVIMQMGKPLVEKFPDAKPLPIMMITGTADPLVPPSGLSGDRFAVVPMVENIHYWKNRNHIKGTAVVSDLPDLCTEKTNGVDTPSSIKKYVWESAAGNEIIWLNVINGGHWLPAYFDGKAIDPSTFGINMGTWNCDYNGAVAIYKFLLSHKRQ